MKKSRTASIGWWVEFQAAILKQMPRPEDIDQTTADAWCQNQKDLKRVLAEALMPKAMRKTYKVVVDYSKSLVEMIKLGNYGLVDDNIKFKNFSIQGVGRDEEDLVLVYLGRDATTKEVLEHLVSLGLEAAAIEHLLAFGAKYPDVQRKFPVICLGSSFVNDRGNRLVPCLLGHDSSRLLSLDNNRDDRRWAAPCRFLAVHKTA
jgi:hypothetical protein